MTSQEFASAYATSFEMTRRFLLSRGLRTPEAEELAQAAWSKAWERRGQLRQAGSMAAWVNTIALNLFRNQVRDTVVHIGLKHFDHPIRPSSEQMIDAVTALGVLDRLDRKLMVMNVLVGLTSKEIAARSSLSAVAVRVRLCRARREIRARLADAPATLRAARMAPRFDAGPAWTTADSCC